MKKSTRRSFIRKTAFATAAIPVLGSVNSFALAADEPFSLPPLRYSHDALEPYIDTLTMQIHHGKHHQGYVNNLNKAVADAGIKNPDLVSLLKTASKQPLAIRNNGGGHYNHSMFWELMTPAGGGEPKGPVSDAINASFGSFSGFREKFNAAAGTRFGSGWAWLLAEGNKLTIGSTPNQDNPLMDISEIKGTPIMGIDVWEHAYYLKYQNKRADYVNAWWSLINWDEVNKRLATAK